MIGRLREATEDQNINTERTEENRRTNSQQGRKTNRRGAEGAEKTDGLGWRSEDRRYKCASVIIDFPALCSENVASLRFMERR